MQLVLIVSILFFIQSTFAAKNVPYEYIPFSSGEVDVTSPILNTSSFITDFVQIDFQSAGDFNGDGYEDLIISYSRDTSFGIAMSGTLAIVYGPKSTLPSLNLTEIVSAGRGILFYGSATLEQFGHSNAPVGDINQDGYDDILVGCPSNANCGAFLIYGNNSWPTETNRTDLNAANSVHFNTTVHSQIGFSVTGLEDFNGDGVGDFAISATATTSNFGRTFIIYGNTSSEWFNGEFTYNLDNIVTDGFGTYIDGNVSNSKLGNHISTAGDFNNDGKTDILIQFRDTKDQALLLFGSASLPALSMSTINSTYGSILHTNDTTNLFGYSMDAIGDFNGDNIDDIIIGASEGGSFSSGRAYIIYGSTNFPATFDCSSIDSSNGVLFYSSEDDSTCGYTVAGIGDFNIDGLNDVAISCINWPATNAQGSLTLYYGTSTSSPVVEILYLNDTSLGISIHGTTTNSEIGRYLRGIDFDVDGVPEFYFAGTNSFNFIVESNYTCPSNSDFGSTSCVCDEGFIADDFTCEEDLGASSTLIHSISLLVLLMSIALLF